MKRFVLLMMSVVALFGATFATNGLAQAHTLAPPRVDLTGKGYLLNDLNGFIGVPVTFKCSGISGTISVSVTQTAMQSGTGIATTGTGSLPVKCDGRFHKVSVGIAPFPSFPGFNLGPAIATAKLTVTPLGIATDTDKIKIVP